MWSERVAKETLHEPLRYAEQVPTEGLQGLARNADTSLP
jgi:hypothetical protein